MRGPLWLLVGLPALVAGACGGDESAPSPASPEGGADAAPVPGGPTDGGPLTDAGTPKKDAGDGGDAGGPKGCPNKNVMVDPNNCGACDRKCGVYSPQCIGGECEHLVFVTTATKSANLAGLDGADAFCTSTATAGGAAPPGTPFKAWLSTGAIDVSARLQHGKRRYLTALGATVAVNWIALVSGSLVAGIGSNEFGIPRVGVQVRTGTSPLGFFTGISDCGAWNNDGSPLTSAHGISGNSDFSWTQDSGPDLPCGTLASLYCIEQ